MDDILTFLQKEGVDNALLEGVSAFRKAHAVPEDLASRVPQGGVRYLGTATTLYLTIRSL